jgi:hypothetical protein
MTRKHHRRAAGSCQRQGRPPIPDGLRQNACHASERVRGALSVNGDYSATLFRLPDSSCDLFRISAINFL